MKYIGTFQVKPGSKVHLNKINPGFTAGHKNRALVKDKVEKYSRCLHDLQYHLYAEGKHSLLICLQGLDAAGKDGIINHVFGVMNPQGTRVCGFKVPTKEEAAHDFLWRIEKQIPAKGEVVIFNRSHYEDVLAARVHKIVPEEVWSKRYDFINCFEKRLLAGGTHILKFFLYISPQEQLKRFRQRLDDPSRHWKISEADYEERKFWSEYARAYEDVLSKTSTAHAPWYIIPSDHKWFRNLVVSKIVNEKLESLKMKLPSAQVDVGEIRRRYHEAQKKGKEGAIKR
ncbi:MAG: polyphosphate kinase 2 family protein [Candidatus Omnitrophota bacterium]